MDLRNKKEVSVKLANDNAEGQIILSGNKETIKLSNTLKRKKLKSIPLKVSAPFHCSLMKPAAEAMQKKLKIFNLKNQCSI